MRSFPFFNFYTIIFLFFSAQASFAAESNWIDVEGAKMRLLAQMSDKENHQSVVLGVVEIELEPGWITYWRDPGGSGIPPDFKFSQDDESIKAEIFYPAPIMIDDGYAPHAGYENRVEFPFELHLGATHGRIIKLDAFVGICKNICVPFPAQFQLDLTSALDDDGQTAQIEAAFSALPQPQASDFKLERLVYNNTQNVMEFDVLLPDFLPKGLAPELFVKAPQALQLAQPVLVNQSDNIARFEAEIYGSEKQIDRWSGDFYLLLKLGQRSVDTTKSYNFGIGHN